MFRKTNCSTRSTPARPASDAEHRTIAKEMDNAFLANVVKHRKIQGDKKGARKEGAVSPTAPRSSLPTAMPPSTKVPRATPEQHAQIDREMNEAFARNVKKNKQLQADARAKRLRETSMPGALELQLEKHWRSYLPQMTADLEQQGVLQQRLHETAEQMRDEYTTLVSKHGLHPDQAHEMTRAIGFLPAEDDR